MTSEEMVKIKQKSMVDRFSQTITETQQKKQDELGANQSSLTQKQRYKKKKKEK